MSSDLLYSLVMAFHAIYGVACLRIDEVINAALANLASKAFGVIRVVSSGHRFIQDWLTTYITYEGAFGTYWGPIGEDEDVGVGGNLISALGAFEAVNMEERLARGAHNSMGCAD